MRSEYYIVGKATGVNGEQSATLYTARIVFAKIAIINVFLRALSLVVLYTRRDSQIHRIIHTHTQTYTQIAYLFEIRLRIGFSKEDAIHYPLPRFITKIVQPMSTDDACAKFLVRRIYRFAVSVARHLSVAEINREIRI